MATITSTPIKPSFAVLGMVHAFSDEGRRNQCRLLAKDVESLEASHAALLVACQEVLNEVRAYQGESEDEPGPTKDLCDILKIAIANATSEPVDITHPEMSRLRLLLKRAQKGLWEHHSAAIMREDLLVCPYCKLPEVVALNTEIDNECRTF